MSDLSDFSIVDNSRVCRKDEPFHRLAAPSARLSSLTPFEQPTKPVLDSPEPGKDSLSKPQVLLKDVPPDTLKQDSLQPSPPNALHSSFVPQARFGKPKLVLCQSMPRHVLPSLAISPPLLKPHFTPRKHQRSAQTALTTALHPLNASLYASHFPPGHLLDEYFVSSYAPGAETGSGAYGFVITAIDVSTNQLVAVKFIEKRKIPSWGWYDDPELGRIPTEVALLRTLDHPGVIKFIELFEDSLYFYFVQELHGSPWSGGKSNNPIKVAEKDDVTVSPVDNMGDSIKPSIDAVIGLPTLHHVDFNISEILITDMIRTQQTRSSPISSSSSSSESASSSSSPASDTNSLANSAIPTPKKTRPPRTPPPPKSRNIPKLSYDLFECIEQHRHFSETQARYIFRQIVDVVYYLDGMGIFHRDIKDENVLIDNEYRVKLIDFGSAVRIGEPGEMAMMMSLRGRKRSLCCRDFRGTLAYAPPEILSGTNRRDEFVHVEALEIWSLGLLLGFLLTGRNLFPTEDDVLRGTMKLQNCRVARDDDPPTPIGKEPVISSLCYHLLTRCLDPDPMTRATVEEVKAHAWLS